MRVFEALRLLMPPLRRRVTLPLPLMRCAMPLFAAIAAPLRCAPARLPPPPMFRQRCTRAMLLCFIAAAPPPWRLLPRQERYTREVEPP